MNEQTVIERNVNQEAVNSVRDLSLSYIETLERLKREIKEANEMIKENLLNDDAYIAVHQQAEEAAKKRKQLKQQLMGSEVMFNLSTKLKDLQTEQKGVVDVCRMVNLKSRL